MIGIVDYGCGNLASIKNSLDYLNIPNEVIDDPEKVAACGKVILPGVGAYRQAMNQLDATGMKSAVLEYAASGKQLLGICLGMQLLLTRSHEQGVHDGLDLVPGTVEPLSAASEELRVPNIGWCRIEAAPESRLLAGIHAEDLCFYFVHSYYCKLKDSGCVSATLQYGATCDVVLECGNVFGCQFHPEKSQHAGMALLKNFWEMECS
ncbi:imidazole glycerol phosphate synthase subunit HisH [Salidesulfovibrio onnuriiensis]|uniref:imidazole glycerol phosphate synthase subunit HisH n=1 Tax=Salidesulfovibrio onnuriiensis TaxID=2583823 RepID=UPI0011C7C544|nr:imidazole glycerol phosphate synthase subunit HisH [Salidesulfovibrio onnuriiensis]